MSAYVIGSFHIHDPEGFAPYGPASAQSIQPHGGEVVVADFASEAIEGEVRPITVVMRFPDKDAVHAWYNSEEYQAIRPIRQASAHGTLTLVDEFVMPTG
jgi:uncharacterized protein (DUF1330 family)